MIPKFIAISAALLSLPSVVQAQGTIPQPVIDQCNSAASASDLPDCLKNGAISFDMLKLMRSDEFYGAAATPVIDGCAEQNETFSKIWVCFKRAASDAVEAASLIGSDKIADRCVAGVSDAALHERIDDIYKAELEERFPDARFSGGEWFSPFKGCPGPAEEEKAIEDSSKGVPTENAEAGLDAAACSALGEVKDLIDRSSEAELRAFDDQLRAMEEQGPDEVTEAFGISKQNAEYLLALDEDRGRTFAMIFWSFVSEHHPDLLMEFYTQNEIASSDPADQISNEIARSFIEMLIEEAGEEYKSSCQA